MKSITVGILAHVDSGKTTLSEALLYTAGSIRKFGRVDHADCFLDTHELERERGITIFSKQARLKWKNTDITLLDTPGHVDFSPETERTLSVLDAAILVISGTDGVQSHTETLWRLLKKHGIPTFLFINKMDVPSADRETLMSGIRKRLSPACVEADKMFCSEDSALCSEKLMEKYLSSGELAEEEVICAIGEGLLFPCYFGSALRMNGIEGLLDGMTDFIALPEYPSDFGARVYKISRDENQKRLCHIKVTGGTLSVRDAVRGKDCNGNEWEEKIDGIRIYSGTGYESVTSVSAGTVCTVTGLTKAAAGQVLGYEDELSVPVLEPVFGYRLILPKEADAYTVYSKLRLLEEEEPQLRLSYNTVKKEIRLLMMGQVQLEIIKNIIYDRFGYDVDFDKGGVVYKETVKSISEGVGHYEPLRHYAEVHLIIEPAERGSGISICTDCPTEELARSWQNLVVTHLEEKTHLGVLTGSPVTDVKITLVAGRAHKKHTEGGDFREATYRALRHGLMRAESILLEPYYNYEIRVPENLVGRVMTDMQRIGATINQPELCDGISKLTGYAPAASIGHYGLELADFSHGKGVILCTLRGYEPCHNEDEVVAETGYNPDADMENPCDSVFCANGAGFLVKWYDVEKYMHIESVLGRNTEAEEQKKELRRCAESYLASVADDNELMRIFEMTYGPVRRKEAGGRIRSEVTQREKEKAPKIKPKVFDGEEYILVDGYNIIFAWDELKRAAMSGLDLARNQLITRLCNYQGFCGSKIILVFDAYKVKKNPGTVEDYRNVCVVYTKEAETADAYIERVSKQLSKKHRVRVATSDGPEQLIILGNGALRVPAAAFHKEVTDAENEIRNLINS